MAYSEALAERVRAVLTNVDHHIEEKRMFGGLAFLVNEKMCINVGEERLMFRTDPVLREELAAKDGCEAVFMRGREYKGYFYVSEDALADEGEFEYWVNLALDFNKRAKSSKRKKEN